MNTYKYGNDPGQKYSLKHIFYSGLCRQFLTCTYIINSISRSTTRVIMEIVNTKEPQEQIPVWNTSNCTGG